jgi:predicted RNA binding protein YcfA (HicA-like mRNA interferase family)
MSRKAKLPNKALNSPNNMAFDELCSLAEEFGYELARTSGSHRWYKRTGQIGVMNFQPDHGKAKPYQVKQLLRELRVLDLIEEDQRTRASLLAAWWV